MVSIKVQIKVLERQQTRYPNCEKAKAFRLFEQGKRPSEIYAQVKVTRHTLYCYYQQWKREKEKESEIKRLAAEHQQRLERERKERERKEEEEFWKVTPEMILREQYENQKRIVWELEASMSRAYEVPNNENGAQRVGKVYSQEYEKFRELTRKLYPKYADEDSIWMALHQKQGQI